MSGEVNIIDRYEVESQSKAGRMYVVSKLRDDSWQCSCIGWTRHMPRRDCQHITWVRMNGPRPIDPMLLGIIKARRKAGLE